MVTSMDVLRGKGGAREIEISGWDGDKITVKLRRPGLYAMMATGRIANPLVPVVEALMTGNTKSVKSTSAADAAEAFVKIAEIALVEPTWKDLAENGITLTDAQLLEIYTYVAGGPEAIAAFRERERANADGHDADSAQESFRDSSLG